jgi:protein tyrosine phosphatase
MIYVSLFSSGTGRTGTYIAVDIIIRLLDRFNNELSTMILDIMGIVNQLKHDRAYMVQTPVMFII